MINKYVVEAYLYYVYAAIGDNINAVKYSKDIIDNGAFSVTIGAQVTVGFNSLANAQLEMWWGFDITLDNSLNLASWWSR